jgi:hypothetical protein
MRAVTLPVAYCRLLSWIDLQRRPKPETERGLRWEDDLMIAGKCRSAYPGASTRRRANRRALTAAGDAANDGAKRPAPAGHYGGTFAFALFLGGQSGSLNPLLSPIHVN